MKYVIEDEWQLAACTRALERAVGDRLNVERALAPRVSHPDAGIERAIVRRERVSGAVLGILCTVMAALLLSVLSAQLERWNRPLEAVTAHLMSCKTTARPKSSATLEMTLDVAPYRVRTDEVSALLPACAQHAYVDIVYRELGFARTAWALSVRRVGGPELVSEAETARSWRANDRGVAAAAGAFGGLALAFFAVPPLWSRSRGNRRGVLTR